jgi:hypothetical protein
MPSTDRLPHGPVPERVIVCGLVGSPVKLIFMLALSAPWTVGVKVTATVQVELGGVEVPQVPPVTAKSPELDPLKPSLIGSENPDRLFTIAFKVFDGVLKVSVPNASFAGVTVAGLVAPVLSEMMCRPSGSGLAVTASVADSVPIAPGLNDTYMEHSLKAFSVAVQVPPST